MTGVVLAAALTGCGGDDAAQAEEQTAPPPVVLGPENITVVAETTLASGPSISGTLAPFREAQVRAEVQGAVLEARVEQGASVKRGTVLARIDATTLRDAVLSARAAARSAENNLQVVTRNAERSDRLASAGAVAERDLEQARYAVINAEAALADARARLVAAEEQLAKATVRAPFDGVVSERQASAGDVVQPGTPLYTVVDPASMELEASVPAEALASLKVGTPVEFGVSGYGDRRFTGRVDRINPTADPETRQVRLYVTIPNAKQSLVAGLFAEGRVEAESRRAASVPVSAVSERESGASVLRLAASRVQRVPIKIGLRDDVAERVEVVAGLAAGDTVLLASVQSFAEGTVARVRSDESGRALTSGVMSNDSAPDTATAPDTVPASAP